MELSVTIETCDFISQRSYFFWFLLTNFLSLRFVFFFYDLSIAIEKLNWFKLLSFGVILNFHFLIGGGLIFILLEFCFVVITILDFTLKETSPQSILLFYLHDFLNLTGRLRFIWLFYIFNLFIKKIITNV